MLELTQSQIDAYRSKTFYSHDGAKVGVIDQAVDYIDQRGFILFWPNKGILCPSLWTVVAGNRPVADEHDDPGHITWGWKDELLGKKRVYYSRVIKHRNTFISLALLPSFYALSPNYGSPEEDYLLDYEAGLLTAEAKAVYEAILDNGPLDTIALRKAARLTSKTSDGPFNKALDILQISFRILPIGVAQAGAWNYAFIYDLVPRHYPWVLEKSHLINEWDARRNLIISYLYSVGAAKPSDIARILSMPIDHVEKAAKKLVETGMICQANNLDMPGDFLTLPSL